LQRKDSAPVQDRKFIYRRTKKLVMIEASVLPYFLVSGLFLMFSLLVVNKVKFFQAAVKRSEQSRYTTLDGLRGFLAISVFFHHAVCTYNVFHLNTWNTSSNFYSFLGEGAVSFFFMITGFLFWSKIIKDNKINILDFYRARARRIYPMYWFSLAAIVLITLAISNYRIELTLKEMPLLLGQWLLCIFIKPTSAPFINGIDPEIINGKVYWTLVYEILFYLAIPILAWFVKPSRFLFLAAVILCLGLTLQNRHLLITSNFIYGMISAYMVANFKFVKLFSKNIFSAVVVGLLFVNSILIGHPHITNIASISLVFVVFLIIVNGNSLFGLLTMATSRYLGIISYGIYVLHGIVLFVVFNLLNNFYPVKLMSPPLFWLITALCGLIVIVLSSFAHCYIEYPFMSTKKSLPQTSS
jgi:peptidoglycan/LPS O-acetylase OafA/YrhL